MEVVTAVDAALLPPRFRANHREHVHQFGIGREVARQMGHRREIFGRRKDGSDFPARKYPLMVFDWLRDQINPVYEAKAKDILKDAWAARDDYINVILERHDENLEIGRSHV